MYIWYISLYEPLPIRGEDVRPMRSGLLCEALVKNNHQVELWLPGFEHVHHKQFKKESTQEKIDNNYNIQYLKGPGYNSDTSYRRFFHNKAVAKEFEVIANNRKIKPDIILTQVPLLELAESVINFAQKENIPSIVDIRDPWPEIYQRLLPGRLSFLYPFLFFLEIQRAKRIFSGATHITAVSETYLLGSEQYMTRKLDGEDRIFPIGYPTKKHLIEDIEGLSEKYEYLKEKFLVFFAGTLGSNFDTAAVINAARLIEKKDTNIHFVIAGKGEGSNLLRNEAKESAQFTFLDWIPLDDLQYLLSISSIGLAPFPKGALNSLPNKPYEYMSASLPIICSLAGELKTIIEAHEIGLYYPAGDFSSLANSILELYYDQNKIDSMSTKSYKLLIEKYDAEDIYECFSEYLYKASKSINIEK